MANFDPNLLIPINVKNTQTAFDPNKLKPITRANQGQNEATSPGDLQGFEGIRQDLSDLPANAAKGISNFIIETVLGSPSVVKQLFTPDTTLHTLGNVGAGFGDMAKSVANAPSNLKSYIEGKFGKLPKDVENSAFVKYTPMLNTLLNPPHIPDDLGIESKFGLDDRDLVDKAARNIGSLITPGSLLKVASKSAKTLSGLAKDTTLATENVAKAEEALNAAKESAKSSPDVRTAERSAIRAKIEKAERDKQKLMPTANQEVPAPHDFNDVRNITNQELTDALQSEEAAAGARQGLEQALTQRLFTGYENDLPVAEAYRNDFNNLKQELNQQFNQVEQDFANENIQVPRNPNLDDLEEVARRQLRAAGIHLGDDELSQRRIAAVMAQLEQDRTQTTPRNQTVPGAQLLSNYRTMQSTADALRDRAYTPGPIARNKDLQAQLLEQATELDTTAQQLNQLMRESGLGASLDSLREASDRWGREVASRYGNETHNQLYYNRTGPSDIAKSVRGEEPGNRLIRQFIQSDPELVRRILGQRHGNNIDSIHDFSETTHNYLEHADPETQALLHAHGQSLQRHAHATQERARAERAHKQAVSYVTEQEAIATKRAAEIEKAMTAKDLASKSSAELDRILVVLKDALDDLTTKHMDVNTSLEQKFRAAKAEKMLKDRIGVVKKFIFKGINLLQKVRSGKLK